jgi:hypothetical protein
MPRFEYLGQWLSPNGDNETNCVSIIWLRFSVLLYSDNGLWYFFWLSIDRHYCTSCCGKKVIISTQKGCLPSSKQFAVLYSLPTNIWMASEQFGAISVGPPVNKTRLLSFPCNNCNIRFFFWKTGGISMVVLLSPLS